MGKIIPSPAQYWPGQVVLPDSLNFPQYIIWQDAVDKLQEARKDAAKEMTVGELVGDSKAMYLMLPAVLACVERWELANFPTKGAQPGAVAVTELNFPRTPIESSLLLLAEVLAGLNALVTEADHVPNE